MPTGSWQPNYVEYGLMLDRKEYMQKYYQEHKEETAERGRKWRREHPNKQREYTARFNLCHPGRSNELKFQSSDRLKFTVLLVYSDCEKPKCRLCGIDDIDILTIDHIDDNGAELRRASGKGIHFCGRSFYSWLRKKNYPEGYQTLCANCQLKKEIVRRRNGRNLP